MATTIKKKPIRKKQEKNDRLPTRGSKPGKCNHQGNGLCFMVKMGNADYHYPDEVGAVMFALRHSRDLDVVARVFDPNGDELVVFKPRTYDVSKAMRVSPASDELQQAIARAHRQKTGQEKKASTKKPLRKKVK